MKNLRKGYFLLSPPITFQKNQNELIGTDTTKCADKDHFN